MECLRSLLCTRSGTEPCRNVPLGCSSKIRNKRDRVLIQIRYLHISLISRLFRATNGDPCGGVRDGTQLSVVLGGADYVRHRDIFLDRRHKTQMGCFDYNTHWSGCNGVFDLCPFARRYAGAADMVLSFVRQLGAYRTGCLRQAFSPYRGAVKSRILLAQA